MLKENLHRDFDRLLAGFLSGELSPDELALFQEEIGKDPDKRKKLDECQLIWDSASPEHNYDLDAEWALMKKKLPAYQTRPARSIFYYAYRMAAVLVLGLLFTVSWLYLSRNMGMEHLRAADEPVEVVMEEGTRVLVNRHSSLKYRKGFDQELRKVYLSGEAWFDVARDTTRPFVVEAGSALVKVLGTSFNVNAYKQNPTVEITVESGLVALSAKADQKDLIVMKAGSGGSYHKSQRELKLIPDADPNNKAWKTRELFFEESSLQEVAELLNRVYDVNIVIVNQDLAGCPITVTFKDQTIDAILNVLELTLDLKVERKDDEIRLHGEGCLE